MLILIEEQEECRYGSLCLSAGQRVILHLTDDKKEFLQLYPDLTHAYPLRDILEDKVYYIYTEYVKLLLRDGTIL